MLHLIHNLTSVWPKPIRDIVMKNWLLNPSGLPNRFVEMDLVQEHLNLRVKVSYKARGSNASWEWLETISPCVVALGDLQNTLNDTLGGEQGKKHAAPDLKADIESLMSSLDENDIYRIKKGRTIKEDDIVKDVIAVGLQNLTTGEKNPISDYNTAVLQEPVQPPPSPTLLNTPPILPATITDQDDETELFMEQVSVSEVEQILVDLANGVVDETLPRLSEEDVAYDMDEVVVEEEEIVEDDDDDSDTDDDKKDIGWISEGE